MSGDERDQLILSLKKMVEAIARARHSVLPSSVSVDDIVSSAWLGAIHAVDRFDPDRGVLLTTFARWTITGAIVDYLRRLDPVSRPERKKLIAANAQGPITFSLTAKPTADGRAFDFGDQRSLQAIHRIEARLELAKLCKANPVKPRALRIIMRRAHGETMKNIGALEGIGEARVSQICKDTYARLRKAA